MRNIQNTPNFDPRRLRKTVLDMAYRGSTVHIGCAFSIIELLAVLYRQYLRYEHNDPESVERDYFVLSKGHGVMAQYACMKELGWLPDTAFEEYFSDGSNLKGLSDSRIHGLEVTSGSLGHGFSVGVGMALGAKINGTDQKTYVLVGDGELNEGPIWEGALFAAHHNLKNFMLIVDQNNFQAMGSTSEILQLNSIAEKLSSFGFVVDTVDGHNEEDIDNVIHKLWSQQSNSPRALVAKTIKGKGVSFMENDNTWHYRRLNEETYALGLAEIESELS